MKKEMCMHIHHHSTRVRVYTVYDIHSVLSFYRGQCIFSKQDNGDALLICPA